MGSSGMKPGRFRMVYIRGELVKPMIDGKSSAFLSLISPQPNEQTEEQVHKIKVNDAGKVDGYSNSGDLIWVARPWYDGNTGSYLGVRESFREFSGKIEYRTDYPEFNRMGIKDRPNWFAGWRPAIRCEHKHARLFLQITKIDYLRFNEISKEQAMACAPREALKYSGWNLSRLAPVKALTELHDRLEARKPRPRGGRGTKHAKFFASYPSTELALRQRLKTMKMPEEYKGRPWKVFPNPFVRIVHFKKVEKNEIPKFIHST